MAAATSTERLELKPIRSVLFVLGCHVIALFALRTLQNNVIPWHFLNSLLQKLLNNVSHRTGTDRSAALADSEAEAFFHGDRGDELDLHLDVVSRHDHLDTCRQVRNSRDVSCTEV